MERRVGADGEGESPSDVRAGALRLLFAGTPAVATTALRALLKSPHEVVGVVTRPDAPSGRGRRVTASPVADLAREHGLEVLTPRRPAEPAFLDRLRELHPDCCAVVAYGALIPPAALEVPRHGWVNLHFSLLPAWRGAAPVQHAIRHGDEITGATTFRLEEGLDTGPIFGTVTEPIRPRDTAGSLLARLAESGAELLVATLAGIEDGSLRPQPQPPDGASYAPKLTAADARVDWAHPAVGVDRLIRACTPEPGAWTEFRGERLRVGPVQPLAEADGLGPGEIRVLGRGPAEVLVGTATAAVRLGEVQPAGRRPMLATDWARGARPDGARLG